MATSTSNGKRGMICIYRMSNAAPVGSHEDTDTSTDNVPHVERVELGPGARDIGDDGNLTKYANPLDAPVVRRITTGPQRRDVENPSPLLDEARRPDISYGGAEYTITVNFPIGSNLYSKQSRVLKRLLQWEQTSGNIKGRYPWGRYGVRNDAFPFLDCEPNGDAGYLLSLAQANWDYDFDSTIPITIILRHVGEASRLNTGYYLTQLASSNPVQAEQYTREDGVGQDADPAGSRP